MAYQPKSYRKFVATAATATLVATAFAPFASAHSFKDVETKYNEAVDYLVSKGVTGYTDGTFKTQKTITRLEAAEMLGKALGLTEVKDAPASGFTDVPARVATLINAFKAKGITAGKTATTFGANDNITRGELAIWIQKAYDLKAKEGSSNKFGDVADRYKAAVQALVDNEITQGTTETTFGTTANAKRGDYALFIKRAVDASTTDVASVKAINATTVEVTYKESVTVEDIAAAKYTIDGLTVSNAAIKQTDSKTVVLTTSAQEGGKTYTVKNNGTSVGTFKGVSAVIPTAVDVTTSSIQGVIGQEVTLKAQVTVKEGDSKAGVPVTFNIVNGNSNNKTIEVEATTDENGVASYSYTRYYASEDNVTAYATSKSSVFSAGKVYWDNKIQLAVSEITAGNELANETKKSYKVTGAANTVYYVAIKENLGVTPDKVVPVKVQNYNTTPETTDDIVTPYSLSTSSTAVLAAVRTNGNGEGSFTIYGSDLSATPIVYSPESTSTTPQTYTYNKLDLQAQASTVKFSQINKLAVTVVAEGTANSAETLRGTDTIGKAASDTSIGGRTYTATVTDKDGKVAPAGTKAFVTFEAGNYAVETNKGIYFQTGNGTFESILKSDGTPKTLEVTVGAEGKAKFRIAGNGSTSFVKPTVFLNTAGTVSPAALDKTDVQAVAEVTYFKSPVVTNAVLTVTDAAGRTVSSIASGQYGYFTYQTVDQNGFAYRPTGFNTGSTTQTIWVPVYKTVDGQQVIDYYVQSTQTVPGAQVSEYTLSFDVTSTFGNATTLVTNADGSVATLVQNLDNTKTYQVKSDANGKAIVRVTSSNADTVTVNVTGTNNILPTKSASISFTGATTAVVLEGTVAIANAANETVKVGGQTISFKDSTFKYGEATLNKDQFVALLDTHNVTVKAVKDINGVYHFTINSAEVKSSAKVLTSLKVAGEVATVDGTTKKFTVTVPAGTTVTKDSFVATVSPKAKAETTYDAETKTATIKVLAEDGTEVSYTGTVTFADKAGATAPTPSSVAHTNGAVVLTFSANLPTNTTATFVGGSVTTAQAATVAAATVKYTLEEPTENADYTVTVTVPETAATKTGTFTYKVKFTKAGVDPLTSPVKWEIVTPSEKNFKLSLMHMNDTHASLANAAKTVTAVKRVRDEKPEALLLNAGDVFSGTLYFNEFKGQADLAVMNLMKYDAMTFGNHEFDLGSTQEGHQALVDFIKGAKFPFVSSNVNFSGDEKFTGLFSDLVSSQPEKGKIYNGIIKEINGEKIGIFGLTTEETEDISSPDKIQFENYIAEAQKAVKAFEGQGVNKIIALTHIGYDDNVAIDNDLNLAKEVEGIDIIVGGHSHTELRAPVVVDGQTPTVIVQAKANNEFLGTLDVEFDKNGVVVKHEGALIPIGSLAEDPEAKQVLAPFKEQVDKVASNEIGVETSVSLENPRTNGDDTKPSVRKNETILGNIITDGMLAKAKNVSSKNVVMALQNGGGIRSAINEGPITVGEVIQVLPFGNTLAVMDVTGTELKAAFEHSLGQYPKESGGFLHVSGAKVQFDSSKPAGQRVVSIKYKAENGQYIEIQDMETYTVATNAFTAQGGDGFDMFRKAYDAGRVTDLGLSDWENFREHLQSIKTLPTSIEGRIVDVASIKIEDVDPKDFNGTGEEPIVFEGSIHVDISNVSELKNAEIKGDLILSGTAKEELNFSNIKVSGDLILTDLEGDIVNFDGIEVAGETVLYFSKYLKRGKMRMSNNKWKKLLNTLLATSLVASVVVPAMPVKVEAVGPATDLIISEYIEGSSNNKAIELYNGTGATIDLSEYKIELYTNGKTTVGSTLKLTSSLNHGETIIFHNANSNAELKSKGGTAAAITAFNGDDTILLKKNDSVVDSIGQLGFQPNKAWTVNGVSTADQTLVRKSSVITGDTNPNDEFDPSEEWDSYPVDTFSNLGSHVMDGVTQNPGENDTKAAAVTASIASGTVNAGTTVTLSSATEGATIYYTTDGTDPTAKSTTYTAPITIDATTTIKAVAVAEGLENSEVKTFTYKVDGAEEILSIADARTKATNETVIIKGVVAAKLKNTISVQDATGGIAVRPTTLDVQIGDEVTLTGALTDYMGLLQLGNATILSKGTTNVALTPKEVTEIGESVESQLVSVENITLKVASSGTGWVNYTATDENGKTFLVRDENASLGLIEDVKYEQITGIVQQFNSDYQIIPRSVVDIVLDSSVLQPVVASPAAGTFVGTQNITLTTSTAGAEIYYTLDGTEPKETSTKYTGPIAITKTTTLKAIVKSVDGTTSEVATFDYKITDSLQIHDIQGESHVSPLLGETVKDIQGIVTYTYKIGSNNYFHMQTPDSLIDDNPKTSEAIIVFTGNQVLASKGNLVKVTGRVDEFQIDGYADTKRDTDLSVTQLNARIDQGGIIKVEQSTVPLPAAVTIDASNLPTEVIDNDGFEIFDPEEDAIDFWESLEGMLVEVGSVKAVAPQEHGDLITVLEGRPTDTIHGGVRLTEESANPDRIQFKLFDNNAARNFEVATGDKFSGPIQGVVNYGFQNYKIYVDYEYMKGKHAKGSTKPETTTIKKDENKLTVASYNLENFSNNTKETSDDKAKKLARAFVKDMQSPDIIGVTEVQDNNGSAAGDSKANKSYERLIAAIKAAGGPTYEYLNIDPVNNADGGAPNANIRVGFLYNPERVSLPAGIESGDATTAVGYENGSLTLNPGRIDPTNTAFNSSRKPLAAQFTFQGEDVIVIANHWNSKSGDTPLFGSTQPPVYKSETQRKKIAQVVYSFVEDIKKKNPEANIVSLGDFNDYQFTDALKIHEGKYMTNMINKVEDADRYTYLFQGNSQVLDHILVSNNLVSNTVIDILHINADFTDMAGRASDHDPVMVQIDLHEEDVEETLKAEKEYTFNGFKTKKLTITKPSVSLQLDATSKIENGIVIKSAYSELHGEGFKTTSVTVQPASEDAIIDLKGTEIQKIIIDGTNVKEIRGIQDGQVFEYINGATPAQIKMTNVEGDPFIPDPSLPSEPSKNNPPVLMSKITNQVANFGETVTIDLANHFKDPDGDPLSFTSTKGSIIGTTLTLSLTEGTHIVGVTASDGKQAIHTQFLVEVTAAVNDGYYASAIGLTGQALKQELHEIIDDHKMLTYNTAWEALRETDEDPNNTNNVILFYSGKSVSKSSNGGNVGNWNREHVWAKSHGNFGTSLGPGTDIHHLRPTDTTVNSSRGSLDFDIGGTAVKNCDQCKRDSDSFEPPDEVKGDVARILFYMATRYESGDKVDLELNDKVNNGKTPYHGKLSQLLQWHKQDPVSEFEKHRNDVIFKWQGNRNPFIDHPEWVEQIWN